MLMKKPGFRFGAKERRTWNNFFTALRQFNKLQWVISFGVALLLHFVDVETLFHSVSDWTEEGSDHNSDSRGNLGDESRASRIFFFLLFIISLGTVSEMLMWLGHMWVPKPDRKLPFWPISLVPFVPGCKWWVGRRIAKSWYLNSVLSLMTLTLLVYVTVLSFWHMISVEERNSSHSLAHVAFANGVHHQMTSLPHATILAFCLFLLASSVDGWRLHYSHYWLAGLFSFSLTFLLNDWKNTVVGTSDGLQIISPTTTPTTTSSVPPSSTTSSSMDMLLEVQRAMLIIFGSLYMWTGYFKWSCPEFYDGTAQMVFGPVFHVQQSLVLDKFEGWGLLTPNSSARIEILQAGLGVFLEMCLGILMLTVSVVCDDTAANSHSFFFTSPLALNSSSLSSSVILRGLCLFNLAMHLYIVIFVGWNHRIETFVSWNAMCAAVVALTILPSSGGGDSSIVREASLLLSPTQLSFQHWVLLTVMNGPPLQFLLGLSEDVTLCHMWFVPGASGRNTLLFKYEAAAALPTEENGAPVPLFRDNTLDRMIDVMDGSAQKLADALHLKLPEEILQMKHRRNEAHSKDEQAEFEAAVYQYVKDNTVSIDGEWVDRCFRLHPFNPKNPTERSDLCNENFGAGPLGFWQALVASTTKARTLRLVEYHHNLPRRKSKSSSGKREEGAQHQGFLSRFLFRTARPKDVIDVIHADGTLDFTKVKTWPSS